MERKKTPKQIEDQFLKIGLHVLDSSRYGGKSIELSRAVRRLTRCKDKYIDNIYRHAGLNSYTQYTDVEKSDYIWNHYAVPVKEYMK